MPKDSGGKFHLNKQRADASDRSKGSGDDKKPPAKSAPAPPGGMGHGAPAPAAPAPPAPAAPMAGGMGVQGAAPIEHPGATAVGQAAASDPGKHHMLVSSDQLGGVTMHHAGPDGQVSGPHDFQNLEELKASMDQFLTEEQQEGMGQEMGGMEGGGYGGGAAAGLSGLEG